MSFITSRKDNTFGLQTPALSLLHLTIPPLSMREPLPLMSTAGGSNPGLRSLGATCDLLIGTRSSTVGRMKRLKILRPEALVEPPSTTAHTGILPEVPGVELEADREDDGTTTAVEAVPKPDLVECKTQGDP